MSEKLFILGAGAAFPSTKLTNELLLELSEDASTESLRAACEQYGANSRYTSLSIDYLKQTQNSDPFQVRAGAEVSPTDLGFEAAKLALKRAGIQPQQLGLIIGASGTPYQTTPSEAQRIGEKFQLKIPAFDMHCGSADIALHFKTLSAWKRDRVPEYVLCVSTNTPTQRVNYKSGNQSGALFGDAAFACVVSREKSGPLCIEHVLFETLHSHSELGEVDIFGALSFEPKGFDVISSQMKALIGAANAAKAFSGGVIAFGGLAANLEKQVMQEHSSEFSTLWSQTAEEGIHFGSSGFTLLSRHWDQIKAHQDLCIVSAGIGQSSGLVRLTVANDVS